MPAERDRHPDDEELEDYAMGAHPGEASAELEEHLLTCAECRDRLSETDAYISAMRQGSARLRSEENVPRGRGIRALLSSLLRRSRRF